ncbi:bifunctional folylpolyglutamate synthase/dihydrofolate synthase [Anaerocolumna chitinilytica]|uniref:tetrahydrofolate synthase n=1 Tax=Anaerocolumna chitinilytica TaxID=1727145 RepID=A0A7I8DQ82_9FIRM|nr:folylpolyglutamate synthase/dihydrofolate synthase family protein [Anaerocolumna chitinilytica]BCK00550.1 bifunctional folylpolyglutamate synthase/dihydrofolate synthase [Anaerocolumna chitinilytica]
MNITDAMIFLEDVKQIGSRPGLATISQLLEELGSPQKEVAFVHVAGTNGKGSVSAYIATILASAGYVTGRFSSPAVFAYREMIQLLNKNVQEKESGEVIQLFSIEEEELADCISEIKAACSRMIANGKNHPTIFEIETATAFLYFLKKKCDIAVIEVGMGGKLDATNVIDTTKCAVLTAISMDHMEYLGDTLQEIAEHKAGIIKRNIPVVTYQQQEEVQKVIEKRAIEKGSSLIEADFSKIVIKDMDMEGTLFDYSNYKNLKIKLLGKNQVYNAVTAILAVTALHDNGFPIKTEEIYTGLESTVWEGRFQPICKKPLVIIDGAHNEGAAEVLAENIRSYLKDKKLYYIMGMFKDKDYKTVLQLTGKYAREIYCITPPTKRGLHSKLLAEEAISQGISAVDAGNVETAIHMIADKVKEEENYAILAFGSLSILKQIKESFPLQFTKSIGRDEVTV